MIKRNPSHSDNNQRIEIIIEISEFGSRTRVLNGGRHMLDNTNIEVVCEEEK